MTLTPVFAHIDIAESGRVYVLFVVGYVDLIS
jgi:hypothetical protein